MRLERSGSVGMGIRVWRRKKKRKKEKKRKRNVWMQGKKVKKKKKITIKCYYSIFTIFHNKF